MNAHGRAGVSAHDAPYPAGGGCHGGLSPFETRNVLAIAGARVSPAVSDAAVGNIDIAPTVLDLLGLPGGDQMDGRSLLGDLGRPEVRVIRSEDADGFRTCLSVRESDGRRYLDQAWVERS